ncbi:hypothetical protein [Candidatus Thiosymbion oneisti]|uniref:hypothetical protein n=1 Tax=Candidatus Thiosymbion oneisti TaxID=589554 RepID=UPI00105E963D|nr:hypothetical protein [Candidatus Thiosymbion oneisti]
MILRFVLLMAAICPGLLGAAADPQTLAMGFFLEDPEKPSPSPGLEVFIEGNASYRLGEPVLIRFELRNHTPERMEVLKWGTPLEGKLLRDMFAVELGPHATPVPYRGPSVKRGTPTASDFVTLEPNAVLSAEIDLAQGYALDKPGSYFVRYRRSVLHHKRHGSVESEMQAVQSNPIEFIRAP